MSDTDVRRLILATAQYAKEIERVRKIDPEAADYMDGPARELPDFLSICDRNTPDRELGHLNWAFVWSSTPQRWDYWNELCTALHPDWAK